MDLFTVTAFAEGEGQATQAGGGMLTMIIYLVAMVAVFYFLLIRPQRKRDKEAKQMMESLAVGDKIVSIGGIYGKITKLKEDTIEIESGSGNEKSTIKLARSAVKEVLTVKE